MTRKEQQEAFEINKHYASVLRGHFGWVSCHTNSYGCQWENKHGTRGMMPSDEVRRIGAALEAGETDDQPGGDDGK